MTTGSGARHHSPPMPDRFKISKSRILAQSDWRNWGDFTDNASCNGHPARVRARRVIARMSGLREGGHVSERL